MEVLNNIIEWFKSHFGIKPVEKTIAEIDSDYDSKGISVTATLSESLTTLATVDSSVDIVGDNKRAKYIDTYMRWVINKKLSSIGQICLGTGDCLARPNVRGKRLGIDIISNKDFIIVDCVGDFLLSVLIRCEVIKKNNKVYERWEYHRLNEDANGVSYVSIEQFAFVDNKRVDLSSIAAWENMLEYQVIPNVDRLLLGRFKCPKVNRHDVNSKNGVPITYGNEEIVKEIKASYRRFNNEFEKMEPMIFADKTIFKSIKVKSADGKVIEKSVLPKGKDRIIMNVNANKTIDGGSAMKEWAPNIRDASLEVGIERNFRMLELFCGLSEGILSKSSLTYTNVDEVRKSTQATYAMINRFRSVLEEGLNDLIYAVNIICNFNSITPPGNFNINYDWSDSYIESMAERFNQLLQGLNMDAISKAEFRSWLKNEPLEVSEKIIAEMEQKSAGDIGGQEGIS